MNYTTGQAAAKLNSTIHTLRYYDDIGLTPFVKRNSAGSRVYTDTDLDWIYMIKCLRDIDMPIRDIKEYISLLMQGERTVYERRRIMQQYKCFVETKINSLQTIHCMVEKKLEYYNLICSDAENRVNKSAECSDYQKEWEALKKSLGVDGNG